VARKRKPPRQKRNAGGTKTAANNVVSSPTAPANPKLLTAPLMLKSRAV
jgi:hypothetical protein